MCRSIVFLKLTLFSCVANHSVPPQASIVEVDIIIPAKFHNSMIGAGGKLIQSVSEECGGVAIKFPPPGKGSEKSSDKVCNM